MGQVINTNSLSLLTQNNLNKSQSALNTAIQRLSSGLRINSAKDDAAGQAIANRFTSNIKGLTQATRNANDGISIAQTTEGALTEVNNNLQRVRELSVQAANGTNSQSDLSSIQAEIKQRMDEIDRVSKQTQFNGIEVMSEKAGKLSIQVGANDGQTIDIELEQIDKGTLGLNNLDVTRNTLDTSKVASAVTTEVTPAATGTTTTVELKAKDTSAGASWEVYVDNSDADTLYVSNDSGTTFYAVTGYDNATGELEFDTGAGTVAATATAVSAGDEISVGSGVTVDVGDLEFDDAAGASDPQMYVDETGNWFVSKDSGASVIAATFDATTGVVSYDGSAATAAPSGALSSALTEYEVPPTTTPAVAANMTAVTGTLGSSATLHKVTGAEGLEYVVKSQNSAGETVYHKATAEADGDIVLGDQMNADPLAAIDKALAKVDDLRSSLGAVQNRFDSTIANLGTTITNLSSSRSRIEDADYAVEVSNMTRAQILQQAGTSVLAQANQTTQGVMSLLR